MRTRRNRLTAIAIGAVVVAAGVISPALGGPSLKALVKKEVSKQIGKAQGPTGAQGTQGPAGAQGTQGPAGLSPGQVLPAGTTLTGIFAFSSTSPTPGNAATDTGVSFGGGAYRLGARPTINVIGALAPGTTNCPGTAADPQALPGHLCLYITSTNADQFLVSDPIGPATNGVNFDPGTQVSMTFGDGKAWATGFAVGGVEGTSNSVIGRGSWAVTS